MNAKIAIVVGCVVVGLVAAGSALWLKKYGKALEDIAKLDAKTAEAIVIDISAMSDKKLHETSHYVSKNLELIKHAQFIMSTIDAEIARRQII